MKVGIEVFRTDPPNNRRWLFLISFEKGHLYPTVSPKVYATKQGAKRAAKCLIKKINEEGLEL